MLAGAVLGIWSFGGPVSPPPGFQTVDALPRRLIRLAHIAWIALPILNLLYVSWIRESGLRPRTQKWGCGLLLFGTLGLPVGLATAAFWSPALYVLPAPVTALTASVFLLAFGMIFTWRRP